MRNQLKRNKNIPHLIFLFSLCAASANAQALGGGGPFTNTLNALQAFAQGNFAHVVAILALIFGSAEMAFGTGHSHGKIGGMLLGVGAMIYSPQIVQWLFP